MGFLDSESDVFEHILDGVNPADAAHAPVGSGAPGVPALAFPGFDVSGKVRGAGESVGEMIAKYAQDPPGVAEQWMHGEKASPVDQRQKDIQAQAEQDRHQIILEKVQKREADVEKSGLPPARFPEWVKEWNAKNGMS